MSGGSLNYWNATEPIDRIEQEYIFGKNRHGIETLEEFKHALYFLNMAEIYAHRIEWYLSGDDSEESFHERLKEDLEEFNKKGEIDKLPCLIQKCKYCEHFDEKYKKCGMDYGYDDKYKKEYLKNDDSSECYDFDVDTETLYDLLHPNNDENK